MKLFLKTNYSNKIFLIIILILSFATTLPWVCSTLMPDIFTPILILALTLIIFESEISKNQKGFYYIIFIIACSMHLSHLLFSIVMILILLILNKKYFYNLIKRRSLIILFLLSTFSIIPGLSAFTKSKHIFFFGAMVEHGIVKEFLNENCQTNQYKLCEFKDHLPKHAYEFVWNPESPFYKCGGWKGTEKEFNEIIFSTLSRPKYIWLHIKASFFATVDQLTKFDIGDGLGSFDKSSLLYQRIEKYCVSDINFYKQSSQFNEKQDLISVYNILIEIMLLICLISILITLIMKNHQLNNVQLSLTFLFFISIIINAWNNGTFANALDRLGSKVIWMIPFLALLLIFELNIFGFKKLINKNDKPN